MSEPHAQADAIAMKGGGYYSTATKGAKDVIDQATPLVMSAIDALHLPDAPGAVTLSDMGCADGGTSLAMITQAIGRLRERNATLPIRIVYSDQPRNDYNALFQILHGLSDFDSYLEHYDAVFTCASATSFYRPIVPPETLDLGFSATAMHWLSRKPGDIEDHVHMVGAHGEALARFAEQARQDWERILLHRAQELKRGGRLVLINFCRDPQGQYLGNTGGVNMFDTFNALWRELVDEGTVSDAEYRRATLPQYYNTVEEFAAPLHETDSPVYRAGLRMAHIETRIVRCPFALEFERHGDARRFATEYIPTLRSWSESTFAAALDTTRDAAERQAIIERFYGRYADRVAAAPQGHAMDYVHAYMVIEKH